MTNPGDTPPLDELEPLEDLSASPKGPVMPASAAVDPSVARAGLPAPFYNRTASRDYYRMLFGGVLMFVGCLMPFGFEWEMAGYKTMSGGVAFVLSLGLIWASWGAIHTGRPPSMKWFILPLITFVWMLFHVLQMIPQPGLEAFQQTHPVVGGWGELFTTLFDREDAQRYTKVGNFFRGFGTGKVFVLIGSFLAVLTFILGIFGGAKVNKEKQKAEAAAIAARRRR